MGGFPPGSGGGRGGGPSRFGGGPGGDPTLAGATQVPVEKRELFRGRSSHTVELWSHVVGGTLMAAGLVGAVVLFFVSAGLLSLLGLLVAVAGGAVILRGWLRVISVEYRVDTVRVEIERGIVRRRIDNLELWRVKDLQFRQSLLQRMLATGDVVLVTSDATNPTIEIRGIKGARELYEGLRDAVDEHRRARSVVGIETST